MSDQPWSPAAEGWFCQHVIGKQILQTRTTGTVLFNLNVWSMKDQNNETQDKENCKCPKAAFQCLACHCANIKVVAAIILMKQCRSDSGWRFYRCFVLHFICFFFCQLLLGSRLSSVCPASDLGNYARYARIIRVGRQILHRKWL